MVEDGALRKRFDGHLIYFIMVVFKLLQCGVSWSGDSLTFFMFLDKIN